MDRSFSTDNPNLVDEIVCEVKSQGVFDQFRRNCIADVDTKPAYQNLRQRVENIVSKFLSSVNWQPDLNKNQLRDRLRKHITEAGFLETGVERIVDQVVNPKINAVFLPKIEEISYKYLGIEKPKQSDEQIEQYIGEDTKANVLSTDLDLEAVSPDSSGSKQSFKNSTEDLNQSNNSNKSELNDSGEKVDDDFESPAFEPLKGSILTGSDSINGEDDSKLSDISGLTSQDSVNSEKVEIETKATAPTIEIVEQPAVTQSQQIIPENINQDSVLSQVSSNSHLSIVTDSNNKSSEVDICEEAQMPKFSENSFNPEVDDKDRKPLLTSFDIKQDEIIFEGTERRSSLHNLEDDITREEDVVLQDFKESTQIESIGDESFIKTESSSFMDPIINETKDLSLKDDFKSDENEFKFEEPIIFADSVNASVIVTNQSEIVNDKHKLKDSRSEKRSDGKSEHKSHRRERDRSSASHHSRDKHKDSDRKHSTGSKYSSNSSSSKKDHRSESREAKKSTDHRRDESSKSSDRSSLKNVSSFHLSSRDKDSNHKSSRSHEDKHSKDRNEKDKLDKNRSKHDRSSNKSRSQHRSNEDKLKCRSHDEDGKKKSGHDLLSKSKATDDDHAFHREKHVERRRSTDRDSDDGTPAPPKQASTNTQVDVNSLNSATITNSTSSSSFSSTASSCNEAHEKQETIACKQSSNDSEVKVSFTDSENNFVPPSAPVVVDEILIGNDINFEMLMEKNTLVTGETDSVMSMIQQSLCDSKEKKIKKPKVASNIFEARKLMKVRKQIERDEKKRLEKLLVQTKYIIGSNTVAATRYGVDEQGVELEFAVMNSSGPSISSPMKAKDVQFEGLQAPASINDKRNSGEFIIDMKEMEKELKSGKLLSKKTEKPMTPKFVHKFDEILSQIDRPRKRESKGSASPASPNIDKSPRLEPPQRKKEQTIVEDRKTTSTNSSPRQQRDERKSEKSSPGIVQEIKLKKIGSPKAVPASHSHPKCEQRNRKDKIELPFASSSKSSKYESSKDHKTLASSKKIPQKQSQLDLSPFQNIDSDNKPQSVAPKTSAKDVVKVGTSVTANKYSREVNIESDGFSGFPVEDFLYGAIYVKHRQTFEANMNRQNVHLLNCDKAMCDIFSYGENVVWDISNDHYLLSESSKSSTQNKKLVLEKNPGATKEIKMSVNSRNGVRTTETTQQKLFIENNQFADNKDAKIISRKRKNSGSVQESAAKIVRLVDSEICSSEDTSTVNTDEASPTPSEQSKENKIIDQVKKPVSNRTADSTCTSNDHDQQSADRIGSNNKPNQRYASDDLYKPRPILSRTRRRGFENGEI